MKLSLPSRVGAVALAGVIAVSLTACGSDDPIGDSSTPSGGSSADGGSSNLSGQLNGSGASTQTSAMDAWRAGFQQANSGVTVNYDPIGSGGGVTAFLSGAVQWAGSDSPLVNPDETSKAKDRCFGTDAMDLPVYVSPIAVVFNLKGVDKLNLSAKTIAQIFDGKITTWDDAAIKADNPDADLPSTKITPIHRSDESGTTKNFTDYLNQAGEGAWSYDADKVWPIKGGESGAQTQGLIQAVQGGDGTIGYADESQAGTLGQVSIKVGDTFTAPSAEGAAAALDASPRDDTRTEHDIAIKLDRTTTAAGAYPLVLVSYAIACGAYDNQSDVDNVKAFLTYISSSEGQQAAAGAAGSAPISDALAADVKASIDTIKLAS